MKFKIGIEGALLSGCPSPCRRGDVGVPLPMEIATLRRRRVAVRLDFRKAPPNVRGSAKIARRNCLGHAHHGSRASGMRPIQEVGEMKPLVPQTGFVRETSSLSGFRFLDCSRGYFSFNRGIWFGYGIAMICSCIALNDGLTLLDDLCCSYGIVGEPNRSGSPLDLMDLLI